MAEGGEEDINVIGDHQEFGEGSFVFYEPEEPDATQFERGPDEETIPQTNEDIGKQITGLASSLVQIINKETEPVNTHSVKDWDTLHHEQKTTNTSRKHENRKKKGEHRPNNEIEEPKVQNTEGQEDISSRLPICSLSGFGSQLANMATTCMVRGNGNDQKIIQQNISSAALRPYAGGDVNDQQVSGLQNCGLPLPYWYQQVNYKVVQPITLQHNPVTVSKPVNIQDSSNLIIGENATMHHAQSSHPPATHEQTESGATVSTVNANTSLYDIEYPTLPPTAATRTSISQAVRECIEELRHHYIHTISRLQPIPWCDWNEVNLTEVYTKLELMIRQGEFRSIHYDEIFHKNFGASQSPTRIYICGDMGKGKSTLCRKLSYDWAKDEEYMKSRQFSVLLLIEVRQLKSSIKKAIFEQLLPGDTPKKMKQEFLSYIQNNQARVAIILDGIDELDSKVKTDIKQLIEGRILRHVTVLVTSRPESRNLKIHLSKYDRFIVDKGYTLENAISFIHKYFRLHPKHHSYRTLIENIRTSVYLRELATNPLNVILMCVIWQENQCMPKTRSELYDLLEYSITRRFCLKNDIEMTGNRIPECCNILLNQISEIAFRGILHENYRFDEAELIETYGDSNFYKMGFMTKELTTAIIKVSYILVFAHKSIQERFAARKLMMLSQHEKLGYLKMFSENMQFYNVLVFASGFMKQNNDDLKFLINTIHEAHCPKELELEKFTAISDDPVFLFEPFDISQSQDQVNDAMCLILECLHESECNERLGRELSAFIDTDEISIDLTEASHTTLYGFANILVQKNCPFKFLKVKLDEKSENKWDILQSSLSQNLSITHLMLVGGLFEGMVNLVSKSKTIETFSVKMTKLIDHKVVRNLASLKQQSSVRSVRLDIRLLLDRTVSEILQNLLTSGAIDDLKLTSWQGQLGGNVSNDVMSPLCIGIEKAPSNFTSLSITVKKSEAKIFDSLKPIYNAVAGNNHIQKFSVSLTPDLTPWDEIHTSSSVCGILSPYREQIANGLKNTLECSCLTELRVGNVDLQSKHASILSQGLDTCQNINALEISGSRISNDGVSNICSSLKGKPLLRLILRDNEISDDGLEAIINLLIDSSVLETIDISQNPDITEKTIKVFGEVVGIQKNVKVLGLLHFMFYRCQNKRRGRHLPKSSSVLHRLYDRSHRCCSDILAMQRTVEHWWIDIENLLESPVIQPLARHYAYTTNVEGEEEEGVWYDCL